MLNEQQGSELIKIARGAIAQALGEGSQHSSDEFSAVRAGVFVTLRTKGGELRGCIGHLEPFYENIAVEIEKCAVSAALEDRRFPPLSHGELKEVTIELSILTEAEEVQSISELDPKRYGVVVTSGRLRGTLLPNIEGIDTVSQQLSIAKQKAGILEEEDCQMFRYEVQKFLEK